MSKSRTLNTHFWDDTYIAELDPIDKLLFLYLLTCTHTNMLGVYEVSLRKISFDTGINKDKILEIFEGFKKSGKAEYEDGYVLLKNFSKHQRYNENMKKSAIKSYNELPDSIKNNDLAINLVKSLEPYPKGSEPIINPLPRVRNIEVEVERENEIEKEVEVEDLSAKIENFDDAKEVAEYLLKAICDTDPTHRYNNNPPSLNGWIKDIDLAIRRDGREREHLLHMIEYIYYKKHQSANWWQGKIESGKKLRDKFDTIKNQILKTKANGKQKPNIREFDHEKHNAFIEELFSSEEQL